MAAKVIPLVTKTQRQAASVGLSIEEITEEYLNRQSEQNLIRIAVQATQEMERAKTTVELVKVALEDRFQKIAISEFLSSEFGFAERKVRNEWTINDDQIEELRSKLGKEYSIYIEESQCIRVVPEKVQELYESLGDQYEECFLIDDQYKPTKAFINIVRDPNSTAAQPKVQRLYKKFISVESKASIKFKPVENK